MKLNVPEVNNIRKTWHQIQHTTYLAAGGNWNESFKVFDRHGTQVPIHDWYQFYLEPGTTRMAFKITKAYWAKGRKMRIESGVSEIKSGEYVVTWKAVANSYDKEDFVVVEYANPTIISPKQALAWLEQRMAELEAADGITTDKIIRDMKVR